MNPALKLEHRTFPSRIADLGFTARLPADWIAHDLPGEEPDFSKPASFFPLAIVTAPHAAIVFTFAARPAFDDGTLHDWAWYLLQQEQLVPRAIGPLNLGALPAITGEATQASDVGIMVVRFAFLEDGGRLINITLTAPELLADSVQDAWFALLNSFTLTTPRGSRFQTDPGAAAATPPPAPHPEQAAAPPPAPQEKKTGVKPARANFAAFALAENDASLSNEHPINTRLREHGAGMVPEVIATDDQAKFAIVAASSIRAQFRVPFGWHVMDDGRRALVFEPGGEIQTSLHLLDREGRNSEAIFDAIEAETRATYPNPEFLRMKESGLEMLGVRGIADGERQLEQYHLLRAAGRKDLALCACITTAPARNVDALNLTELILRSMDFGAFPQPEEPAPMSEKERRKELVRARQAEGAQPPPPQTGADAMEASAAPMQREARMSPNWWQEALALEAAGSLEAAEEIIADNVQHLGFAASTAEMYRLRMNRLKAAGDEAGALAAFKKADAFIWSYASMATSGGEGAALSLERDAFRTQLVAEFGSDPEAE